VQPIMQEPGAADNRRVDAGGGRRGFAARSTRFQPISCLSAAWMPRW